MSFEVQREPTREQMCATIFAFISAKYPLDRAKKDIITDTFKRVISDKIVVDYLGYRSVKWNYLSSKEMIIRILLSQLDKKFEMRKQIQEYGLSTVKISSEIKMDTNEILNSEETYTMAMEGDNCVIAKVVTIQKIANPIHHI